MTTTDDDVRVASLIDAQNKAVALFDEVMARSIIRPGVGEVEASDAIRDLANEMFGVTRYWHKRIVRAGENTLHPYDENPPNRVIENDDIAFFDFGPVFEEWEADYGRTIVLGDDPARRALRDALDRVWDAGRAYFETHPDCTGAELYEHVVGLSDAEGYAFGGSIAGHIVGEFPHKRIANDKVAFYVMPGSTLPMRRLDPAGRPCHWILEVHLVDRERQYGGFFEELLDIGHEHR